MTLSPNKVITSSPPHCHLIAGEFSTLRSAVDGDEDHDAHHAEIADTVTDYYVGKGSFPHLVMLNYSIIINESRR